jgi:LAO/AO transport system kinase
VIILESLGVGQDETEISRYVDVNTVVLVPGLGDAMQMAKAGVRETADVFVINKSDKPEAELLKEHLLNSFGVLPPEARPQVVSTVASDGVGIQEAVSAIEEAFAKQKPYTQTKRRERIRAEIASSVHYFLQQKFQAHITEVAEQVYQGEMTPFEASKRLAARIDYRKD